VVVQRSTRAETPLEFYDFFFEAFKGMSRANLLEAMATAPDIDQQTGTRRWPWCAKSNAASHASGLSGGMLTTACSFLFLDWVALPEKFQCLRQGLIDDLGVDVACVLRVDKLVVVALRFHDRSHAHVGNDPVAPIR
jgi:hypothetical protein